MLVHELIQPSLILQLLGGGECHTDTSVSQNIIHSKLLKLKWHILNNHWVAIEESRMTMSFTNLPEALAVFTHRVWTMFVNSLYHCMLSYFIPVGSLPTSLTQKKHEFPWLWPSGIWWVSLCRLIQVGVFFTVSSLLFQSWRELFYWSLFTGERGTPRSMQWEQNWNPLYIRKFTCLKHLQFEVLGTSEKEGLRGRKRASRDEYLHSPINHIWKDRLYVYWIDLLGQTEEKCKREE